MSRAPRHDHRYENLVSSSGSGSLPSLTLRGAPSGTLTTLR